MPAAQKRVRTVSARLPLTSANTSALLSGPSRPSSGGAPGGTKGRGGGQCRSGLAQRALNGRRLHQVYPLSGGDNKHFGGILGCILACTTPHISTPCWMYPPGYHHHSRGTS